MIVNKVIVRQYVERPIPGAFHDWVKLQQDYMDLLYTNAKNKLMFQRQRYYVEGEGA